MVHQLNGPGPCQSQGGPTSQLKFFQKWKKIQKNKACCYTMMLMCLLVPAYIKVVSRFVLVPPPRPAPSHLLNYQIVVVDADRAYLVEDLNSC